eukprot:1239535-Ditylum_brightwellii.AAC.1
MITDLIDDGSNKGGNTDGSNSVDQSKNIVEEVEEEKIVIEDEEKKRKRLRPRVPLSEAKRKLLSKVVPIDLEYDGAPRGLQIDLTPEELKKQEDEEKRIEEKVALMEKEGRRRRRRRGRKEKSYTTPWFPK